MNMIALEEIAKDAFAICTLNGEAEAVNQIRADGVNLCRLAVLRSEREAAYSQQEVGCVHCRSRVVPIQFEDRKEA